MFVNILCYSLTLCLCLYQLTLSTEPITLIRLYKFTSQFVTISTWYCYLCHCSDTLDDCQVKLTRALQGSYWYQCSKLTQKDLTFFLRRLQQSNHLKFIKGSLILSKIFFTEIAKLSYNFVNCMRVGQ
ncbi:hypothetical protein WDU94_009957 [Cyamophila willieti]